MILRVIIYGGFHGIIFFPEEKVSRFLPALVYIRFSLSFLGLLFPRIFVAANSMSVLMEET